MNRKTPGTIAAALFCSFISSITATSEFSGTAEDESKIDFHEDIYPIFEENCLKCHGPDKEKSGFRAGPFARLLTGGDSGIPTVAPGDPIDSYLLELVTTDYEEDRMPPADEAEPLSAQQIALLEKRIEQGAAREAMPDLTVDYLAQMQPIFEANCYVCHGSDKQESGLRTDLRAIAVERGRHGSSCHRAGQIGVMESS